MKKIICLFFIIFVSLVTVFAFNPHSFNLVTDFAYYPMSESKINVTDTHYAKLTGAYSGLEARVTANYFYKIPTPFSDNPLVKGNNVTLGASLEISPVSLTPMFTVSFTPIAFLVFSAGARVGTGWDFAALNVQGSALYNDSTKSFDSSSIFSNLMTYCYLDGLFQFDLGAVLPGDWTHVVMQAAYRLIHVNNTIADDGEIWKWQGTANYCNGFKYLATFLLGYQMPLVLQTVAVQCELEGYFDAQNIYNPQYTNWNPSFVIANISPVAILKFNSKHQLTMQWRFRTRRSYTQSINSDESPYDKTFASTEWYFDRIAFSYRVNL